MATVQHLEKLYEILRIFETSETLEATVASERIAQLIAKTEKVFLITILYQRSFLRDERRRLRIFTEQIEDKEKGLKLMKRSDWIPQSMKETMEEDHILINIGGLMFETPKSILKRDPGSLLAQLCGPEPPLIPDPDGFFFFDRDWWLFRYILNFLRDGILPDDRATLAQLYKEASFWNLSELQKAIEETKLHLIPDTKDKEKEKKLWWRQQPNWWQAIDEAAEKKKKEEAEKKKKSEDWWTSSSYKGTAFLPLSKTADKVVTKAGEKDELPMTKSIWSTKDLSKQIADMEYEQNLWHPPTYRHLKIGAPLNHSGDYTGRLSANVDIGSNPFALPDSKNRMEEIRDKYTF